LELEEAAEKQRAEEADLENRWAQLREEQRRLAQRSEELDKQRAEFEEEKQIMMRPNVGRNDLIGLNFGGEKIVKVKRSLLLQFEHSMLARMFSGRYEDSLDRDDDGNVFLDYGPSIMMPLIEFLRLHRDGLAPERCQLAAQVAPGNEDAWHSMLRVLGMEDVFFNVECFKFSGIRTDVAIKDLHGWRMFFCKPYSHVSTMADFRPPADLQGSRMSLLIAARRTGAATLTVAAMGNADVITDERPDVVTREHNGVHWYCRRNSSVGFAPSPVVQLSSADIEDLSDVARLSWHLNGGGGWRAGAVTDLTGSQEWEKVVFVGSSRIEDSGDPQCGAPISRGASHRDGYAV
jgi:hypothetical protein